MARVNTDNVHRGAVIKVGTVSYGTLRPEDLIPVFVNELRRLGHAATHFDAEWLVENPEDAAWLLADLFDALNDVAPDGTYFGAHEGDGADFGFWRSE
jgi:hypothetical protein